MATPVPELVEELATRIVVLRQGRIIADDSLQDLRIKMGAAPLTDIYTQLIDPGMAQKIDRYFGSANGK